MQSIFSWMDKPRIEPRRIFSAIVHGDYQAFSGILKSSPSEVILLKDHLHQTPLHHAAFEGQTQMVADLLHFGASCEERDKRGWTVLHAACASRDPKFFYTVVRLLKSGKLPVQAYTDSGMTALHYYARGNPVFEWEEECNVYKEGIRLMLSQGANIDSFSQSGETPLMMAATRNRSDIVNALIECGANVNAKRNSKSALQLAIMGGLTSSAIALIWRGAEGDHTSINAYLQKVLEIDDSNLDEFGNAENSNFTTLQSCSMELNEPMPNNNSLEIYI